MEQTTELRIDGVQVQPMPNSLTWYTWANRAFDIRYLREAVGLPALAPGDALIVPSRFTTDPLGALHPVLERLNGMRFGELLDEHDILLPPGVTPPHDPTLLSS